MTDLDRAWLAGLLEGDGCFTTVTSGGRTYPRVYVGMTDLDVVQRVAALIGATQVGRKNDTSPSRRGKEYRPFFYATVSGRKAAEVMEAVLPLMGTRRQARIREVLATPKKETSVAEAA